MNAYWYCMSVQLEVFSFQHGGAHAGFSCSLLGVNCRCEFIRTTPHPKPAYKWVVLEQEGSKEAGAMIIWSTDNKAWATQLETWTALTTTYPDIKNSLHIYLR